tara:strand:+ start:27 stop:368 length:342 start_codon:yes stop_codon:yes gene_type:complete
MSKTCECHLIDWTGGPGNYKIISTGEKLEQSGSSGNCCQTKCNDGIINIEEYFKICQYIPGEPGSKFPQHVYNMLIAERVDALEGLPPISEHLFKENENENYNNEIITDNPNN